MEQDDPKLQASAIVESMESMDIEESKLEPTEQQPSTSSTNNPTATASSAKKKKKKLKKLKTKVDSTNGAAVSAPAKKKGSTNVFLPGMKMKDDEQLECDESAYLTLHSFTTTSPCLSFDVIPDNLGMGRVEMPFTAYLIGGTQAQRSHNNHLLVMKMSNVYKTLPKTSDDELSSDESYDENVVDAEGQLTKKPELNVALLSHHGCVNRVKFNFINNIPYVASWSEHGKVEIWDITIPLRALDDNQRMQEYIKLKDKPKPVFSFKGHRSEGFALDWSPTMPGVLATGDTKKFIHVWRPHESTWIVDQKPFVGHTASVEDIQWSPNEQHVFASCSVDKTIRIWDTRAKSNQACLMTKESAHDSDINVISWNKTDPFIASGSDDCSLKVFDLRTLPTGNAIAEFRNHHKGPVCSVEWNPNESSVLATAGEDDQVAIWDLSLEKDTEQEVQKIDDSIATPPEDDIGVPPQLLFIHQGQQDIKEVHWHPQIPGLLINTAATGFNIFKPVNV